jgi:hypothetical protein
MPAIALKSIVNDPIIETRIIISARLTSIIGKEITGAIQAIPPHSSSKLM